VVFLNSSEVWYVLIGLLLTTSSENAYVQVLLERVLRDLWVWDVMWPAPEPVAERWLLQRVADERVLARAEQVITVTSGALALEAARLMQEQDVHQLLVIDDGRLVGAADGQGCVATAGAECTGGEPNDRG